MPVALARISRERTLSRLVENLFVFEGKDARADRARAARALLRENPALSDSANFKSGMRVVIPADLRFKTTERVSRPGVTTGGLLEDAAQRLAVAEGIVWDDVERRKEASSTAMAQLGDRKFIAELAKSSPRAGARVKEVRATIAAQERERAAVDARLANALSAANEQLQRLMQLAEGAVPDRGERS